MIENCYVAADEYIGSFAELLDKDWTLMIVSDHGLLCREYVPPLLGDRAVSVSASCRSWASPM